MRAGQSSPHSSLGSAGRKRLQQATYEVVDDQRAVSGHLPVLTKPLASTLIPMFPLPAKPRLIRYLSFAEVERRLAKHPSQNIRPASMRRKEPPKRCLWFSALGAKLLPSGAVVVVEVDAQSGILMEIAKVPCVFGLAIAI